MPRAILIIVAIAAAAFAASPAQARKDQDQLPPGLQKKAARGHPLPPGWEKKLAVGATLDTQVYQAAQVAIPVDDRGLLTIRVEGKLIRLFEATREIVEILE